MKIINAIFNGLSIDRFEVKKSQAWCLYGANRSGINAFFNLISQKRIPGSFQCFKLPEQIGVFSFKEQQIVYEKELKKDDSDILDRIDPGTLAKEFLQDIQGHADLIDAFAMTDHLDTGYRQLSTGQSRKLLLLEQITRGTKCLAIQTPYEGLDRDSRKSLDSALCHLYKKGIMLLVFVNNIGDIPFWCTHLGVIHEGTLSLQGDKKDIMAQLENGRVKKIADFQANACELSKNSHESKPGTVKKKLVSLNKGHAGYGGRDVFSDLTLNIDKGEHTLVTGPNGCGKSTLLHVITGDHSACYTNDLKMFGIPRGCGESIWDIKRKMGIVSSDLHRNYIVPGNTIQCILSGLFDSIGLYRPYTRLQEKKAIAWLVRLGLEDKSDKSFRHLSFSDQRLVLIARSLIKVPELLVLDEPTQGLDEGNRKALLDFLQDVAAEKISTILYVSHREDEFRPFFCQQIKF